MPDAALSRFGMAIDAPIIAEPLMKSPLFIYNRIVSNKGKLPRAMSTYHTIIKTYPQLQTARELVAKAWLTPPLYLYGRLQGRIFTSSNSVARNPIILSVSFLSLYMYKNQSPTRGSALFYQSLLFFWAYTSSSG